MIEFVGPGVDSDRPPRCFSPSLACKFDGFDGGGVAGAGGHSEGSHQLLSVCVQHQNLQQDKDMRKKLFFCFLFFFLNLFCFIRLIVFLLRRLNLFLVLSECSVSSSSGFSGCRRI